MYLASDAEHSSTGDHPGNGRVAMPGEIDSSVEMSWVDHQDANSPTLLRRIATLTRKLEARNHDIDALIHRLDCAQNIADADMNTSVPAPNIAHETDRHNAAHEAAQQQLQDAEQQLHDAQLRLAQAQKMVAIGQLAAGIAHELNTPIQYVADNVMFLDRAFESILRVLDSSLAVVAAAKIGDVAPALIERVEQAAREGDIEFLREDLPDAIVQSRDGLKRIASIVSAMKKFSHPSNDEMAATDLAEIIETTIIVARNEWKYVADVVTDFAADLPEVSCIHDEIGKVVLNLIVNAAHAIGDTLTAEQTHKGTITLSTRRIGDFAEICVADTGGGIPLAVRDRVFDPFFTTKSVGIGTGQGLAICHATIVTQHHGEIFFESAIGTGTTFHVRLPLCAQTTLS